MANLESTWSLHTKNIATPKSIAVYPTPLPPIPSIRSSTSSSSASSAASKHVTHNHHHNPFENPRGTTGMRGAGGVGGNPFDVATSSPSNTQSSSSSSPTSTMMKSTYSVIYGTNRGSLHYRTYPNNDENSTKTIGNANVPIAPIGLESITQNFKNVALHPCYQPLDTTLQKGRDGGHSSIVSCIVRAEQPVVKQIGATATTKYIPKNHHNNNNNNNPMFLILQDDKDNTHSLHDSSGSSLNSSTTKNNDESCTRGASLQSYNANLITLHQYDENNATSNKKCSVVLSSLLPMMSSVSYHEFTGYVYTIGSSVYSLPPKAVQTISSSFIGASRSIYDNISSTSTNPSSSSTTNVATAMKYLPKLYYHCSNVLPSCGVRSGYGGISMVCNGHVVIIAMKNGSFYAINGMSVPERFWLLRNNNSNNNANDKENNMNGYGEESKSNVEKILTFRQSSPVHPAISVEIPLSDHDPISTDYGGGGGHDKRDDYKGHDVHTSLVFLASGRECAIVEIMYNPKLYSNNRQMKMNSFIPLGSGIEDSGMSLLPSPGMNTGTIVVASPRHGIATLASPILAAVGLKPMINLSSSSPGSRDSSRSKSCSPLVVILTSDGLVHTRSPSFISIPLSTIEVGNRPNDFFTLQAVPNRKVVAASYSGEARLISFREDTMQDLADRLIKLSINAFGSNGFPRAELAQAIGASFSATSYVGAEASIGARNLLKQYLETCLGLDMSGDFGGAAMYRQFLYGDAYQLDYDGPNYEASQSIALASPFASSYLSATAILCLVCIRLGTPNPSLANRAAKSCSSKFGLVGKIQQSGINASTVQVCELVADILLEQSVSTRTLPATGGLATGRDGIQMELVEAASWLLRTCGQHERSIEILQERMNNPRTRNKMFVEDGTEVAGDKTITKYASGWSQSKYDKHLCSHLEELWSSDNDFCQDLVLKSNATRRLLETNPTLGLRIFTSCLPENENQWSMLSVNPFIEKKRTTDVIELLKSIESKTKLRKSKIDVNSIGIEVNDDFELPLESGRAIAVSYLETGIGITTGKPPTKISDDSDNVLTDIHNELAFLLLEGVLTERIEGESDIDTDLGKIYREKLRRLLGWHSSKVQPDQIMDALPSSFLREKALLFGQLGRHEDALRIFYLDLKSLDLALEYCDARYERQQAQNRYQMMKAHSSGRSPIHVNNGCAYLPLVRVALESDQDSERGIAAAIQVLSLRRENIDRAAALRLLPKNIPVSSLARSFLIPALIDCESQARRLTVTASLLRAKHNRLKYSLTEAQIKSQSILQNVPSLQSLDLGQPVYVSKPFKARPSNTTSIHFPEVIITKHFFRRYVIIQATATTANDMTLGDVKLVVAESSDEALLPSLTVPIQTLPPRIAGSSWCVLAASPQRLDGSATLVCEMHYKILSFDGASNPYHFDNGLQNEHNSRSHVEEINDIEIRRAEFEG